MRYLCLALVLFVSYVNASTVLITGASRGIGLETAEAFQKAGWSVWGVSRSLPEKNERLEKIKFRTMDVTNPTEIAKVVQEIIETDGQIDVLVNNAGYGIIGALESITVEQAKQVFEVNFFGVMNVTQAVIPYMRKAGKGHILNVSSTSGIRALPLFSVYAASKFALEAMTESLAIEASLWNIKVSSIEPGPTTTDFAVLCKMGSRETGVNEYRALEKQEQVDLINFLKIAQPSQEVAQLILEVATQEKPDLRNPTSEMAKKTAAKRYFDPSGNDYRDEQILLLKQLVSGLKE